MSVIVVTEGVSDCLRWTLECLRSQTVASELECLLVTRSRAGVASLEDAAGPLHSLRVVEHQAMEATGAAKAAGVLALRRLWWPSRRTTPIRTQAVSRL